ncbi:GIY-YIG nuclease family protein [Polluticoccus soli]|uniref:GIY-YIG nuclease family protein n=1 Tax=Polluticoccus soli TaxID=3034150 RepID=UPI0023E32F10|nr:GIY-YIG nuclease family protein [Flavipsychrobacter sp. JY13-12]
MHNYYVYITTNKNKTVLYTGVTGNIAARLWFHEEGARLNQNNFTARYNCYHLIYWEHFRNVKSAIARETEIKGLKRWKKEALINAFNPEWRFLNEELM